MEHELDPRPAPTPPNIAVFISESRPTYTFVDDGKIALDLFTCNISLDDKNIKRMICEYFDVSFLNLDMNYFTRGS